MQEPGEGLNDNTAISVDSMRLPSSYCCCSNRTHWQWPYKFKSKVWDRVRTRDTPLVASAATVTRTELIGSGRINISQNCGIGLVNGRLRLQPRQLLFLVQNSLAVALSIHSMSNLRDRVSAWDTPLVTSAATVALRHITCRAMRRKSSLRRALCCVAARGVTTTQYTFEPRILQYTSCWIEADRSA